MVMYCIVPECQSRSDCPHLGVSFYMVPQDSKLLEQWTSNVFPDQKDASLSPVARVCSLHFVDSDFRYSVKGMRFLKKDAVPTVFDPFVYKKRQKLRARRSPQNCYWCNCDSWCQVRKRCVKKSVSTLPLKQHTIVTPVENVRLPSTSQTGTYDPSSPDIGNDPYRKHIMIVRGSEMFAAVTEKVSGSEPSSGGKSLKPEGANATWKTKHIVRVQNFDKPKLLIRNVHLFAKVNGDGKLVEASHQIPTSSDETSPGEKTGVVSQTEEDIPVPSKTQEPHYICPDCKEENKVVTLKQFKIAHRFTIFLCPTEECSFPLYVKDLYRFLYKRLPDNTLQRCSRDEAPTVSDIVAMISSCSTETRKDSVGTT